ncbi:uncharacterized protein LOC122079641 isoform X2 [Macadamia integrifolia]|uniref:uncharacterized protein LOC122079641 isoform X2 n=1 Tax=Macadamia integrifolia TaxID=60698 RepID=UPI001C4E5281|nr:uncharacterized protein LOC122079641 isoform X2 [Macadamia integrifolia]
MPTLRTTITSFTIILLLTIFSPTSTISSVTIPILGLDSFLTQQFRLDPQASNDTFRSLSSSLKKSLSHQSLTSVSSLLSSLLSLEVSVSVNVKLVGSFAPNSQSLLYSFISAALFSDQFHVIGSSDPHRLAIKHSLHFDASPSTSLSSQIFEAIRVEIERSPSSLRQSLHSVPFSIVDRIVKKDFEKEKPVEGVYIYLLNLNSQSKPYAYSYGSGESSPAFTRCLGNIWSGKDRYLWIDLAAGPVDYGPALSGDGVLLGGEFHPLASLHGRPKSQKTLLADLASLVWSAYQVLLVPSLRIPVPFENSLIVEFIHVHGSEFKDLHGLDWKSIERTFMDEVSEGGLLLGDQSLRFRTYEVEFSDCSICSFAISRSMNSYTSRFLFENYTLIVSEYLDSKRLHQILSDSADQLRKLAGVPDEDFGRVLPVYVFDLDINRLLLLDRYHQSVAFRDMVIAVRTRSGQTVSDYSCNGRHVITQTRELERPLVGSILQSMWGVSPTHLLWSARHNTTLVDYTWSVGQTPFGPFSDISSLSFVQKDAARRNVLLTSLNYTITSAIDVLDSISTYGGDRNLFKQNRHVEFVQRWNLFKYKLDKAISALSHLDFEMALYFSRTCEHDLYALHSLVYHTSRELDASLICFKDPPFPWASVSVAGVCFCSIIYVYSKREKLFRNKRKQF